MFLTYIVIVQQRDAIVDAGTSIVVPAPLIFRPRKTRAPTDLHFETRVSVVYWPHLMISQMAIQY